MLKLCEIIVTQIMPEPKGRRLAALISVFRHFNLPVELCVHIMNKCAGPVAGFGRSSYARRRRARSIGRCQYCYRVFPPICNSKCDNKTCKPGINAKPWVVNYIKFGVTEVRPNSYFN